MAPANPANTTAIERTLGSTTPVAIVAATFVPKTRKAMKLNAAAHTTAKPGVSTRVATTVAIELAASWKPLTKSKPSATAMTTTRRRFSTVLGQLCLAAMEATMSLIFSKELSALSNASTTSFQRSTVNALNSPEKRRASVRR